MRFDNLTDTELELLADNTHAAMHHLFALLDDLGEDQQQDEVFWSIAAVNHQERLVWIEEEQQRRKLSRIPPPGAFLETASPTYGEEIDFSSNVASLGMALAAVCVFVVTSVAFVVTGVDVDESKIGHTAVANDFVRARAQDAYKAFTRRD